MGPTMIIGIIVGALIWIGGSGFILLKNKSYPRIAFFVFFFFINYLPTNSVLQMINPFAEYRLYLSNLSLMLLLSFGIHELAMWLKNKTKLTMAEISVSAVAIAIMTIFTLQNVMIWRSFEMIYAQAIQNYPKNDLNYMELGTEYLQKHDPENSFSNYTQARALAGRMDTKLAYNLFLVAATFYRQKDLAHASEVIKMIEQDPTRDPLPPQFYQFKNELEKAQK
jgi:hypothetical protein